jgi:hypothetical protein
MPLSLAQPGADGGPSRRHRRPCDSLTRGARAMAVRHYHGLSVMGVRERERWRKEVASGHVPVQDS